MTALWIGLAVVLVTLLLWRVRRAGRKLDQILREERARTVREAGLADSEHAEQPYR